MTYCLAMKVKEGIVGIADTQITSGTQTTTAKKIFTVNKKRHSFFIMTSGLRSIRDKSITYFRDMVEIDDSYDKLYKVVNVFANQVKRVAKEDGESLKETGLPFNLHALIGGQLENDKEQNIYLLYPQGNWVEISQGTPYMIIGNTGYGKPILDRVVTVDSSIPFCVKAGVLSFSSTRISANDVNYPIDVICSMKDSFKIKETRYNMEELEDISSQWEKILSNGVNSLPEDWTDKLLIDGKVHSEIN